MAKKGSTSFRFGAAAPKKSAKRKSGKAKSGKKGGKGGNAWTSYVGKGGPIPD
jgi:hypothetical protein